MYDDALSESDLILLNSALELVVTDTLEDGSKEARTELAEQQITARHMLNETQS